jgi:hypothetical protein
VTNYSDNDAKYLTRYQRVKALFDMPEGVDTAALYLKVSAGGADSAAEFDDVRVVETKRTDLRGHDYFEDFENIDEGHGPFVYMSNAEMHTHLSERGRSGYTHDVIGGRYSLKTKNETPGKMVYRTLPHLLRLKPHTTYTLSFDYITDKNDMYAIVVASTQTGSDNEILKQNLSGPSVPRDIDALLQSKPFKVRHFSAKFTTGRQKDTFIGIFKNDMLANIKKDNLEKNKLLTDSERSKAQQGILVIDNLAVDAVLDQQN